jgi:hypothetical protein
MSTIVMKQWISFDPSGEAVMMMQLPESDLAGFVAANFPNNTLVEVTAEQFWEWRKRFKDFHLINGEVVDTKDVQPALF